MSKFIDDCLDFIKTQPFEIIRISQMVNGEVETAECTPVCYCQNTYSVAKAFTMTAIGILYDRGIIRLDEKICDIFRDELPEDMDKRWEMSTIEMALSHRLGLPGGFLDIDVNPSSTFGEDYLRYMFSYPLEYTPGSDSKYSDGAFYLLSRIVTKKIGMSLEDFLWKEILLKMNFQEIAWSHCPKGYSIGATGLYIHSSDAVKLGWLYLNNGVYNGKRFLSEEWTRIAVENEFAFDWDETHRIYYKGGMFGQKLIVVPEQKRVVCMQAFGANSQVVAEWIRDYTE